MGSRIILQPVQRTLLRFLENAAQVFSHNTKTHQVQAAENRNQDRHRRPARYSLSCNDTVQYMQDHQHTGHSGKDTDVKSHAERHGLLYTQKEVNDFYSVNANSIHCLCAQIPCVVNEKGEALAKNHIAKMQKQEEAWIAAGGGVK